MEKLYPIGTVVTFNDKPLEYTIIGYFPQNKETTEVFTYLAINASFGISTGPGAIMFNADKIGKVVFEGYQDPAYRKFSEKLKEVPDLLVRMRHSQLGE